MTRPVGSGPATYEAGEARAAEAREPSGLFAAPLVRVVTPVWGAWLVATVAAVFLLTASGLIDPASRGAGGRLWPLWSWDWGWYSAIARVGYPPHPSPAYAFFPLWPAVLRASGPLPEWVLGGIVALAATLLAFAGVAAAHGARPRQTALVLACFPGSVWLALVYPDALTVAAAAWACVFAARGRPLAAAATGALAAVARPTGFLVAVPVFLLARRAGGRAWPAALAPLAAAAAVEGYFWARSGAANAFFSAQRDWHRTGPSPVAWWHQYGVTVHAHPAATAATFALALVLSLAAWRRPRHRIALALGAFALVAAWNAVAGPIEQIEVERAAAAVVVVLCGLLWTLGPSHRIWAAYATTVVGVSLVSGSVQSFGREALLAFPLVFAVQDGPPVLRRRSVAALGIAANVVLLWTLGRFAP